MEHVSLQSVRMRLGCVIVTVQTASIKVAILVVECD